MLGSTKNMKNCNIRRNIKLFIIHQNLSLGEGPDEMYHTRCSTCLVQLFTTSPGVPSEIKIIIQMNFR